MLSSCPIHLSISSHGRKMPLTFSAIPKNHNLAHSSRVYPTSSLPKYRLAVKPNCAASGINAEKNIPTELVGGLDPELMPKHVALIMDGNRRWARSKDLSPVDGYAAGVQNMENIALGMGNMKKLVLNFKNCGVEVLSLYLFAREYCWNRPTEEVDFLLEMAYDLIQKHMDELMGYDVRLTFVGDKTRFPKSLQDLMDSALERAKNNKGLHLVLVVDYSGQYDITQATKRIADKVKKGVVQVEDINEAVLEQHLLTNGLDFPNPDLMIRTGNKFDVGNYMLWQMAYTELHFSQKMFPDFNEEDVIEALAAFQQRQRRFGGS